MKRVRIGLALLAVLAVAGPAAAQQYTLSNTTLSGSISATQTTLVLASASASAGSSFGAPAAGQCLFMDGEFMRIVSMSSTTATVTRGYGAGNPAVSGTATTAAPHLTGAVIFTAACNAFKQAEPTVLSTGNQTCSSQPAPWINVKTANVWWCNTSTNKWTGTNYAVFTYNSVPVGQ